MPKKSNFQLTLEDLDLKKPTKNNILDNLLKLPKKDVPQNTPHHVTDEVNTIQQADLLYLPDDNGFKYLLVVVDLGSRLMDAQEIKNRDATTVRNAMIKLYKRKILQEPVVLQVDDGSEFKSVFKSHFSYFFKIHTHEAGRHRQQALVESRNKILGKIIFRFQQIQELHTGEQNTEWVRYLRKIIQAINKHYEETPEVIDSMNNMPRADGDSKYVYPIGTKVRKQLDHPKGTTGEKLFGKFRSTDYRWDQKISTITSVYLAPDSPPLYQLDNNQDVAYTKNQLQKVDDKEELPKRIAEEKYVIEKLVKRFKKNSKIYFTVLLKGYKKTTDELRSELIKDAPLLVKAFEDKL
jgi:hypothetical protein